MDYSKYVARRLHPVRVTVSLLHHELERARNGKEITLSRPLLESVISTVEIFVEDCERAMPKSGSSEGAPEKKFVETAKQTVKV